MLLLLVTGSVLAGVRWRSDVDRERTTVFRTTASAIASSVATTFRRQTDLTSVERALIAMNPNVTNREFERWFGHLDTTERYPGGLGFGFAQLVPAADLGAFAAMVKADPTNALDIKGAYEVFPPGTRSSYCLLRLIVWTGPPNQLPPTMDYCAPTVPGFGTSPTAETFAAARDSGNLALAYPVALYPGEIFAFLPVYKSGKTPPTVAERRADLLGWVAGTFDGKAIIEAARKGHPEMRVEVLGVIAGAQVSLASDGPATSAHAPSLTVPVDKTGTWSVRVTGSPISEGLSATAQGVVIGALGLVIALLVFGVIEVLLRSRDRAFRLVREQTDELRHRALHDDLTGLPNRALIMDRLDHLLSRSRRKGIPAAVLFIDLDSFKDANDTYGHAVGDALLRAVADRLTASLRESDTAGRIGGDEFVVLAEGTSLDEGAAKVGARVVDVLREPFRLPELPDVALDVRASVGVAVVGDGTADDVLRNADIALYAAKAAGKARYMVYSG
jgi:diguanylate cyclase (GGDEF)-like protein